MSNNLFQPSTHTQWLLVNNRSNKTQVLSPIKLPPPAAVEAANNLNDDELLAVRPGETISVNVRINNGLLAQAVEKTLAEALQQAGIKLGNDGPLTLSATMKNGEAEKIAYRKFDDFPSKGETISVTKPVCELRLLLDGVPIWKKTSAHSPPFHLQLKKGESIHAAIARVMQPTAYLRSTSRVPRAFGNRANLAGRQFVCHNFE